MAQEPELIEIPAGTFTQGEPTCPPDADVPHRWHTTPNVKLSQFLLAATPVTNAQYEGYLHATGIEPPSHITRQGFNDPQQPVVGISWHDADAYVRWLARRTGRPYRLPRDVEWEYAARGGRDGTRFPWGDDLAPRHLSFNDQPHPPTVRQFPANGFGLYDMIGTVWEWCDEQFNDVAQLSKAFNTPTDGDPADNRVLRGGSYVTRNPLHLWIALRHEDPVDLRHPVIGFRLACDPA